MLRLEALLDNGLCDHTQREVLSYKLALLTSQLERLRRREWGDATLRADVEASADGCSPDKQTGASTSPQPALI